MRTFFVRLGMNFVREFFLFVSEQILFHLHHFLLMFPRQQQQKLLLGPLSRALGQKQSNFEIPALIHHLHGEGKSAVISNVEMSWTEWSR